VAGRQSPAALFVPSRSGTALCVWTCLPTQVPPYFVPRYGLEGNLDLLEKVGGPQCRNTRMGGAGWSG
jgi:hypothetical protein